MYNIQWTNEVRFPCYLFSIPPNHGCLGKVCDRKEMDGLQGNCNKTPSYQDRYIRLVVGDFHARLLVHIIGVTSADIEAKRIWIMITNACAVMNVVIVVYFYTMIYHGIRQRRAHNVMLHLTRRFATTIFSATQRCNIIATLFRMVTTLFQHCNAVLRQKSSLRIVPCKITCVKNATALAQARPESNFAKLN